MNKKADSTVDLSVRRSPQIGAKMQYRKFGKTGVEVSALGFGCMRLPVIEDGNGNKMIHEPDAIKMIRHGIDHGINYVDTAYGYHDGMSEGLVGRALLDGYREKVNLATKCPVWMIHAPEDFDRILEEQLARLKTDHVDFYLLHALNRNHWKDVVLKFNLLSKMEQARKAEKIRYIGFSFHDDADTFLTILNGYEGWDFCQIQMNYVDVNHQATLTGLEAAAEKGLGVVVMEPLLGGKLASPPSNVEKVFTRQDSTLPKRTPVEWALDFLWNRPEVSLLLSGMSSMEQTMENLSYASRSSVGMLSEKDLSLLEEAKTVYDTMALVACTKCSYCMPCPFGLDIPKIFEAYNQTAATDMALCKKQYNALPVRAHECKKCKKCESLCPQGIKISQVMEQAAQVFQ